ncbi:hypothetical protein [Sphingomonas sp.]|uniref:hypothetical protein n=1 Tax=Sphingomonas sp. TaxID=28214 RepID=UPI002DD6B1DF|nr:hypothetical protein [Sphingomonas sp.]
MTVAHNPEVQPATLELAGDQPITIGRKDDLLVAMEGLSRLLSGQTAMLTRGPKRYIKAVRHDDLWAVTTRNGSYFTLASFTAAMTTDYSDREAKADRAAGSIWTRICRSISSPAPERSLSTAQVRTLFGEFFLGKRFGIPQSGA